VKRSAVTIRHFLSMQASDQSAPRTCP
jgi:hypothetical protein